VGGHGRHRQTRTFGHGIRAICVIAWNEDAIRRWVTAVSPIILGDGSAWEIRTAGLDPVVVEAFTDLTSTINHNNTIAACDEKDEVVSVLLALKSAGISLDGEAIQGWALSPTDGPARTPTSWTVKVTCH
jgi:hypothetical protein